MNRSPKDEAISRVEEAVVQLAHLRKRVFPEAAEILEWVYADLTKALKIFREEK